MFHRCGKSAHYLEVAVNLYGYRRAVELNHLVCRLLLEKKKKEKLSGTFWRHTYPTDAGEPQQLLEFALH